MKGLLWVFFEKVGFTVLSVVATFWYAILLGPEGFGQAAIILSSVLLISGIQEKLQQSPLMAASSNIRHVFSTSLIGWTLFSVLIACVLFSVFTAAFGWEQWLLNVCAVLYIPISSISRIFVADLLRNQEYRQLAVRSFLGKLAGVSSGLLLAYMDYVAAAVIAQSLVALAIGLIIMLRQSNVFKNQGPSRFQWPLFFELVKEGVPSGVMVIEQGFKSHGLVVLLGAVVGSHVAGLYMLCIKFVDLPRVLIGEGFSAWALGKFRPVKNDQAALRQVFMVAFHLSLLIIVPCYVGLIVIAGPLIENFFGSEWLEAEVILQWLAVYSLIMAVFILLPSLQILSKTTYNTLLVSLISMTIVVLWTALLANHLGKYSALFGIFLSLVALIPKYVGELTRLLNVQLFQLAQSVLAIGLSAFIMAISVVQAGSVNLYLLIAIGVAAYSLSIGGLYYLGLGPKNLITSLKSL